MEDLLDSWRRFFSGQTRHGSNFAQRNKRLTDGLLAFVAKCENRDIPPIFEISHLRLLLGLTNYEFGALLSERRRRYREFTIPKRLGGERTISSPIPPLLFAQKWMLREILEKVELHDAAHGGIFGRSVVTNASIHVGAKCVLKLDLEDFYGSIKFARGIAIFQSLGYPHGVAVSLAQLSFDRGVLPQGAATSPALANISSSVFDTRLDKLAKKYGLRFTRYFDDLTFSGDFINLRLAEIVGEIAGDSGFRINAKKTKLLRGSTSKYVTGLSVGGTSLRLPRQSRRKIRNEAYLLLKRGAKAHLEAIGRNDPLIIERALGHVAFWKQVEPDSTVAQELFDGLLTFRRESDQPTELAAAWRPKPIAPLDPPSIPR